MAWSVLHTIYLTYAASLIGEALGCIFLEYIVVPPITEKYELTYLDTQTPHIG